MNFKMTWEEAMDEARNELGYHKRQYVSDWQELVDTAKYILEESKEEDYEDFCINAKTNYKEYLKSDRWKKLRLKVLERDNFMCRHCMGKATEVHHLSYLFIFKPEEEHFCLSLCSKCHRAEHKIKS